MHSLFKTHRVLTNRMLLVGSLFVYFACSGLECPNGNSAASSKKTPEQFYQYVYVTNEADNTVWGYRSNSDGTLQVIGQFPTGRRPGGIVATSDATDTEGGYPLAGMVFVLNRNDNTISQFLIQNSSPRLPTQQPGLLLPVNVPTIATGHNPSSINFDGWGRIYVTCQGDNSVIEYQVSDAKHGYSLASTLVKVNTFNTGASPIDMNQGVVVNGGDNTVSDFGSYGRLELLSTPPTVTPTQSEPTRVLTLDDSGGPLSTTFFVASAGTNTLQVFDTQLLPSSPAGLLVANSPVAVGKQPSAISSSGGRIYVTNFLDNTISEFAYTRHYDNNNNSLPSTLDPEGVFVTGKGPYDLIAGGPGFYCLNRSDNTVELFSIGQNNNTAVAVKLTALSSAGTGNMPARITYFEGDTGFAPIRKTNTSAQTTVK